MKKIMYKKFLVAVLLFAVVSAEYQPVEFEQCPQGIKPTKVSSQYCSASPCTFVQGGPIGFVMDFISPIATNNLTVTAKAEFGIINLNYRIAAPHDDGCANLIKGGCPLSVGESVTYEMDMILDAPFINIYPIIRVTLRDDSLKPVVCFGVKTHIAKE